MLGDSTAGVIPPLLDFTWYQTWKADISFHPLCLW